MGGYGGRFTGLICYPAGTPQAKVPLWSAQKHKNRFLRQMFFRSGSLSFRQQRPEIAAWFLFALRHSVFSLSVLSLILFSSFTVTLFWCQAPFIAS
jgi:hypothetical protein